MRVALVVELPHSIAAIDPAANPSAMLLYLYNLKFIILTAQSTDYIAR